jgi:prepilin-type N-terminal cleavage/methylation domain-containing protein/prepilin-type processing-associated H-X9-DG protein
MSDQPRRHGFSLIELIVVLAILAVLVGLLVPAVQKIRSAAAKTACADRIRQIDLAFHNYHAARGALPPGMSLEYQSEPYQYMSWRVRLLPYLEQDAIWREAVEAYRIQPNDFRVSPPHPFATVVRTFGCPSDARVQQAGIVRGTLPVAYSSYLGVSGSRQSHHDGVLFVDSRIRLTDISDGTSQTLLIGERPHSADGILGWWYAGTGQSFDGSAAAVMSVRERVVSVWGLGCPPGPYSFGPGQFDNQCDAFHFWSPHPGGAHFAFADGSVRFLAYSADSILPALATRAGGESVALPD